jgi:hypothetical protein
MTAGLIWIVFSLIRGDLANALFNSAGFVVPLAAISIAVGFVPNPRSRTAMSAARFLRRLIEFGDPARRLPARLNRALVGR